MSAILQHPLYKGDIPIRKMEKQVKKGVFHVMTLTADQAWEMQMLKDVISLSEQHGAIAGAVYFSAFKFFKYFGCGFTLKAATEMIYDVTYEGHWKNIFSDEDQRDAECIFHNLAHWIAYTSAFPKYRQSELFKRKTYLHPAKQKEYDKFVKNIVDPLETDNKISLANMMIIHCATRCNQSVNTEFIATSQTVRHIFEEYYVLCNKYKRIR